MVIVVAISCSTDCSSLALSIDDGTHQLKPDRKFVERGGKAPAIGQSGEFGVWRAVGQELDNSLKCLEINRNDGAASDREIFDGSDPHRENVVGFDRSLHALVQKMYRAASHQILKQNAGGLTPADHSEDGKPGRLQCLQNKSLIRLRGRQSFSGAAIDGTRPPLLGGVKREVVDQRQFALVSKKHVAIRQADLLGVGKKARPRHVFECRRLDVLTKIAIAPIATEDSDAAGGMHLAAVELH